MSTARERILARLRQAQAVRPLHGNPSRESDAEWLARQPALGDLAARFVREQEAVGSQVRRVRGWDALPEAVAAWLAGQSVRSVMLGTEPRLAALRERLAADGRFALSAYDAPLESRRDALFSVDCGITTSRAAIAETGSIVLVPTPEEPRLLSLAPPVHLAIVERERLVPRLADFIAGGSYQRDVPSNLVLVSGASRTADIELTLAIGVHGPKMLLVALVE